MCILRDYAPDQAAYKCITDMHLTCSSADHEAEVMSTALYNGIVNGKWPWNV